MNSSTANPSPRVTVLMAVYNSQAYLRGAIESVLVQTYTDFELLIINDGSADGSADIVHSFSDPRITFVDDSVNKGLTKRLNQGLALAKGEYVARLDADDIALPKRLALQIAFLDENPDIVCVGGGFQIIDECGVVLRTKQHETDPNLIRFRMITSNQLAHPSVMFRTKIIRENGDYDGSYKYAQDFELWSRLSQRGLKLANLSVPVIQYRSHNAAISSHESTIWTAYESAKFTIKKNVRNYIPVTDSEFEILFLRMHRNSVPNFHALWFLLNFWIRLTNKYLAVTPMTDVEKRAVKRFCFLECQHVAGSYLRHRMRPLITLSRRFI